MAIVVSGRLVADIAAWLVTRDPYTGRRPIVSAIPFLIASIGCGVVVAVTTGRFTGAGVFLALTAGALVVSLRHLWDAGRALFIEPPQAEVAVATGRRRKELEREKAMLLKALKELDFDHEMRKVSDADFAEIGGAYRARAIRVMRQLDDREVDYARLVEEELARFRRDQKQATGDRRQATGSSDVPVLASGVCVGCGTINDNDAVFCKKCARRLKEGAA